MSSGMAGCANSRHPYTDQLGSVSVATAANGALVAQQEYDPWGKVRPYAVPRATITQTKRNFTGQLLDGTGLLHYNARYYDPAIGRFISADTIVPGSSPLTVWPSSPTAQGAWGTSGNGPENPQQLNRYSYALNNPIKYTDPTGHCVPGTGACTLAGAVYGGAVAGPAGAAVGGFTGAAVDLTAVVLASAAVVNGIAPALASDDSPIDSVGGAEGLPTEPAAEPASTLQPGPYAGRSIPARGPGRDFTPDERAQIDEIGRTTGCHTCGTTDPGTRGGNFVPDHQPPNQLNPNNDPQQLYPHCRRCSQRQGGEVNAERYRQQRAQQSGME